MNETISSGCRSYTALAERGLISLGGGDVREFLQGVITNDIEAVRADRAIYAALLTPQGKFLHDFFVFQIGDVLHLDCEAARLDDLMRRLRMYRLRADVEIADASGSLAVYVLFGDGAAAAIGISETEGAAAALDGGFAYADPRTAALGVRCALPRGHAAEILAARGFEQTGPAAYDRLRIGLGIPDGSRDMELERSLPLEYGLDDLHGVSFEKGCFIGQEVTARMKRRDLVRKRLLPVEIEGAMPAPGAAIMRGAHEAGEIRAASDGAGLALLRLDKLGADGPDLTAGGARIIPYTPGWAHLPK